jgi:hypothetical protein
MSPYRVTPEGRPYEGLRDLIIETKRAEVGFARYGFRFLRQCVGMGHGTANSYYTRQDGPGSLEVSRVSPLDTFYVVPSSVSPHAAISTGRELTQTQAWYKRLNYQPSQGWLNAYAQLVRVRFASESGTVPFATSFHISTRPLIHVSTDVPPEQTWQDCARICSGRMAVSALIAEVLHKAHALTYDNAAVFGDIYDAWQAPAFGDGRGIDLSLAKSLGVPIVERIARRPAALDEAIG